ncbi:MAG TPA: FAD-dependent oxidoreductase [Albitalea sp.]|uniref:NAD(P)/FAD-dependent oxidoreductase n=1 Tax=Piscinibacter sp. TaxID=1903157 RepID=UPI002ED64B62
MREFDVAVIGAGIAGASLAFRIAGQRSTVVLERETQPGMHATGRSAAMFMESYGPPGVRALTRASRRFCEEPPQGFTPHALLAPRGVLYLATHEQAALLQRMRDELAAGGTRVEAIGAAATIARVPCLRPDVVHGALLETDARDIDVHALHQGFLRGLRQQGGELQMGAAPLRAERRGDAWELHFDGAEPLRAHTVVDAGGAWADPIAGLFGARPLGLEPRRRSAFTFRPPTGMDIAQWPAVVGVDESYYFKPDAGQLLGSPANADPTVAHDVMPEELDVAMGIHQIESVTTLTIRRPTHIWAGLRTFAPDGEIVIGFDGACPGFFWLAGQGGYGIQSAAGASELAAALLLGIPLSPELTRHGVDPAAVSPLRLRR